MPYSFTNLEPVCCSKSSTNCCFLTWIQISQEAGKVVWYSYLFNNFPQFLVSHTVKDFGIVNKPDVDVFLELLLFQWSIGCWQFDLVSLPLWNRESKDNWAFQYSDYSDPLLKWCPVANTYAWGYILLAWFLCWYSWRLCFPASGLHESPPLNWGSNLLGSSPGW